MRTLFDSQSNTPFKLSRSKIEEFVQCPRCFYLDLRNGVSRPSWPAFALNIAVDKLLKKEFDTHRAQRKKHPLMEAYGLEAIPFSHEKIDQWRNNFKGISYHHLPTNFIVFGAVDDLWIDKNKQLIIVDYKATSTSEEITLENEYRQAFKREVEIYQWLFRKNGFAVSDTAYFVYVNAQKDRKAFDAKLEFDIKLIPYKGSDKWVEPTLIKAHKVLMSDTLPEPNPDCEYCLYRQRAQEVESGK